MLETIVKQEIIFYIMVVLTAIGIIAKLIGGFTARRMVKAAGQIHKSNHKLMRLVKAKYEHATMVSDKVQNVEAFVDKYIYEYRVFGIRLNTWSNLPKKVLLFVLLFGVFAIFESYRLDAFGAMTLGYLRWTVIFSVLLLMLHFVAGENEQLDATKNYIVEYLENVCAHRYEKVSRTAEEGETEDVPVEESETEENADVAIPSLEDEPEEEKENDMEMRIRTILQEFLA